MASKKTTEAAAEAETTETTESIVNTAETEASTLDDSVVMKRVYVGPSLPKGILNHGTILKGTEKDIAEYLEPIIKDYPQVEHLMVATSYLHIANQKVKDSSTLLNRYCQDVQAERRARKE